MIPPYWYVCLMKPDWGVSVNIKESPLNILLEQLRERRGTVGFTMWIRYRISADLRHN